MKRHIQKNMTLTLAVLLLLVGAQTAQATNGGISIGANPNVDPALVTEHYYQPENLSDLKGSFINNQHVGYPVEIEGSFIYDPIAGPWKKIINPAYDQYTNDSFFDVQITIHEEILVFDGTPWTDWHEEILTPGWEWGAGFVSFNPIKIESCCIPGTPVSIDGSIQGIIDPNDSTRIDFFFSAAVLPDNYIYIWKDLVWVGDPSYISTDPIILIEHPTVPLPGAAWLLGSGLVGLIGVKRRRKM